MTWRLQFVVQHLARKPLESFVALYEPLPLAYLWFGVYHYPPVWMASTRVVLRDPKPNRSAKWCRIVILRSKKTWNSYTSMSFDAQYNILILLRSQKAIWNPWCACCGCVKCTLQTSETNTTFVYDVFKIEIFRDVLNKFGTLYEASIYRKQEILSEKLFQFLQFLAVSQFFDFGSGKYPFLIVFTLRKLIVVFCKFQKNTVKTHIFLKSYGRLVSLVLFGIAYTEEGSSTTLKFSVQHQTGLLKKKLCSFSSFHPSSLISSWV